MVRRQEWAAERLADHQVVGRWLVDTIDHRLRAVAQGGERCKAPLSTAAATSPQRSLPGGTTSSSGVTDRSRICPEVACMLRISSCRACGDRAKPEALTALIADVRRSGDYLPSLC